MTASAEIQYVRFPKDEDIRETRRTVVFLLPPHVPEVCVRLPHNEMLKDAKRSRWLHQRTQPAPRKPCSAPALLTLASLTAASSSCHGGEESVCVNMHEFLGQVHYVLPTRWSHSVAVDWRE
ncbi:hypothetical protein E2C01_030763 [Portunus trituberculatus]|uniref:Uncharacterized protein n=1 Tax=Portunus trituberculatus TaxID=210409 RepID=A0A5B7EW87_PORTR|nr:hypothetical protein [Portunus trituberculatus]